MSDLLGRLTSISNSDADLSGVTGGFWSHVAPGEGTDGASLTLPYATWHQVAEANEQSAGAYIENSVVECHLWHTNPDTLRDLVNDLREAMAARHDEWLADGVLLLSIRYDSQQVDAEPDELNLYRANVQFTARVQRRKN